MVCAHMNHVSAPGTVSTGMRGPTLRGTHIVTHMNTHRCTHIDRHVHTHAHRYTLSHRHTCVHTGTGMQLLECSLHSQSPCSYTEWSTVDFTPSPTSSPYVPCLATELSLRNTDLVTPHPSFSPCHGSLGDDLPPQCGLQGPEHLAPPTPAFHTH